MGHLPTADFSSDTADLVYAISEDGKIVHISEVVTGAACRCRCPACGMAVIAKNGPRKPTRFGKLVAIFFSHEADGTCTGAAETALHLLAKEIVEAKLQLFIPQVSASYRDEERLIHKEGLVKFTRAEQEATDFKQVIPDILVERDGRLLLVEIFVTHPCGDEKLAILRQKGIATLEIDLSKVPRITGRKALEALVVQDAPRHWVFHPKIDAAMAEMKATALKKQLEDAARKRKEVEAFAADYREGVAELANLVLPTFDKRDELIRAGIDNYIGVKVDGYGCFTITPEEWQYRILKRAFVPSGNDRASYPVKALFDWFKKSKLIRNRFRYVPSEIEAALEAKDIGFLSPYHAIGRYLDKLVGEGVLQRTQSYILSSTSMESIFAIRASEALRNSRLTELTKRVEKILAVLPEGERLNTTAEAWIKRPQDNGLSFAEAIQNADSRFEAMLALLRQIEGMIFKNGPIVEVTLYLPIESERERQRTGRQQAEAAREQKRRDNERAARDSRLKRLTDASVALGPDSEAWPLAANPGLNGSRPIDLAGAGDDDLSRALIQLNFEVHARRRQAEESDRLEDLRSKLRDEVQEILGERGPYFLASPYPELRRMKPIDYCVSPSTYQDCINLAKKTPKARR